MRVGCRGLYLGVTKQFADHQQALAVCQSSARKGMSGMVLRRLGRCDMHADAIADAGTGRLHGIVRQMRVTRGRLYLCVTKKLTDHRKALAECQGLGRKGMP